MNFSEKIENWTKGLSFWKLIYKQYKPSWLIITGFTFLLSIASIAFPTYPGNISSYGWMLLCTLPIAYFSIRYSWSRTKEVIRENYPYAYEENKKWNHVTIRNIRKKILLDRLGEGKSNPDFLKFILSAIDRRKNSKNYSYPIIISTISTLLGVYIGFALNGLDDLIKTESDFNQALIFLGGAIVIGILIAVFLEIFIVRDFILNFRNRKNKVIECLEDIFEELEFGK